jgi:DNA-binding SARP family transcriptional activator
VEFRLLGPVEVHEDGRRLGAGSARERFVLAMLLLNANRQVTTEYLVDRLWVEPPASAKAQLHDLVSKLRTRLHEIDPDLIVTRPSGYELRLGRQHRLDVAEFQELVAEARRARDAGDHGKASRTLESALGLWRGEPLTDIPGGLAGDLRQALTQERLAAAEAKLDAELALGHFDDVIRDVQPLLQSHPYREHLYNGLMRALAATGRRADALATYQTAYRRFADDLGVEPGPALRELEQRILRGDPVNNPAPQTAKLVPRQLPPAGSRITGRDDLLQTVIQALNGASSSADTPVVVLVGPGGVGKTTLALAAGHRLAHAHTHPDGQLYADLRGSQADPADPHEVAGRFLRALGVDGLAVPEDADERIAMYRSHLAERRLLIVLDDAATEQQVRPLLPGAGNSAVIVTSRRQLAALMGTTRLTVPELVDHHALDLLTRIAGEELLAKDPAAAERIVGLCGGLPLAVCIAGARLAAQPEWSAAELANRLETERGRLNVLAVGDLDVRASIALSYQALDAETAQLFRLLGRLTAAADWPAWVADAAHGEPAGHILRRLTDIHLVEQRGTDALGQDRYRLHDLVAEYAAEQQEPQHSEATQRVLDGWLALAAEADELVEHGMPATTGLTLPAPPRPPSAFRTTNETANAWFEAERATLIDAVENAARLGLATTAAALALRLGGFLQLRAYDDDRMRVYEQAADCLREAGGNEDVLMRVLGTLFAACNDRADYDRMAEISVEQLELARRAGDRQRQIHALAQAGHAARVRGRLGESADRLDDAIALFDEQTSDRMTSMVLAYRAYTHFDLAQPSEALPLVERALGIERRLERALVLAWRLMAYGSLLTVLDRLPEAEAALTEAVQAAQRVGDELTVASAEIRLADVEIHRGDFDQAAERLRRTAGVTDELGDREAAADAIRSLGDLEVARDEPEQAVKPLRESLARWRRLGRPLEIARVLARLDRVLGEAAYRTEWQRLLADLGLDEASLRLPHYYAQR